MVSGNPTRKSSNCQGYCHRPGCFSYCCLVDEAVASVDDESAVKRSSFVVADAGASLDSSDTSYYL